MHKWTVLLGFLLLVLPGIDARADDARVAVMNLKVSGEYSDQVLEWLPALIEDHLLKKGWTLVVRGERMQHIQQERSLPGVDPETRSEGNTLTGASAFLELTARVSVTGVQGALGFGRFTIGDYVKASVDLTGQMVDVRTGQLKSSLRVGGSAGGLKTVAIVKLNRDWDIGGGGINLAGIRGSLVGKAADKAAARLVEKMEDVYGSSKPKINPDSSKQIKAESVSEEIIYIAVPEGSEVYIGDRYWVLRGEDKIAELEIVQVQGRDAKAVILSKTASIRPTDRARKAPMTLSVE